jgi:alpha-N-arabinofuranosidase
VYLNGYNNTPSDSVSQANLGPYVEEAMNELEFIMGSTSTKYGALRASLGYPKPWNINYVEVNTGFQRLGNSINQVSVVGW